MSRPAKLRLILADDHPVLREGLSLILGTLPDMADALGISEGTVKSHVNNIMQKLGALSRTDAAIAGLRKGLIKM
jgi:DNA-binding NarL/FixJ family response regulator